MNRIDIISFIVTNFIIAWLTGFSGVEMVVLQILWFGAHAISKRLMENWLDRQFS